MTTQLDYKSISNLRDDHFNLNPITGAVEQFLLLERTHYWIHHGATSWLGAGAAFTQNFCTVNSEVIAGPDGLNNACQITASAGVNAYHGYLLGGLTGNGDFQGVPAEGVNRQWGFETTVLAGTITKVDVELLDSGAVYRFNLTTGLRESGPDNKVRIAPRAPGNPTYAGWWRIYSVGLRFGAASSDLRVRVRMVNGAGNNSFNGAGTETLFMSGGQIETNVGMCSLQKVSKPNGALWGWTDGADQLLIALPASITAPQPLTVYAEWLERGNAAQAAAIVNATTPGIFRIGDLPATANNSLKVTQTATGFTGVFNNAGTTSQSDVVIAPDGGDLISLRAVINDAGALTINASLNGATEVAGTTGTAIGFPAAWGDVYLTVNSHGYTANNGDMELRKLHLLPGAIPLVILRDL